MSQLYCMGWEAVRLMNQPKKNEEEDDGSAHFAMALSLPELAGKYYDAVCLVIGMVAVAKTTIPVSPSISQTATTG